MELHPLVGAAMAALGLTHEVMECDPVFADTAAFCEHYGVNPADSANTIVVVSKKPLGVAAACVALATTRLDVNHRVKAEMGVRRLSFAASDETEALTGMTIGGVTPFGMPEELPVLIDAAVMQRGRIVMGGGNRSSKLVITPDVLTRLPSARVVDGLATSVEPAQQT